MKISKLKKIVSMSLILSIILTGNSISFANLKTSTSDDKSTINQDSNNVVNEINEITNKYGGNITIGEEALKERDSNQMVIKVDSKEELDNLIKSVREDLLYCENKEIKQDINPYATGFKTVKYKAGIFKWFYTRTMDFNYETKVVNGKTQLVRVYNRRSYPSGISVCTWKEKWHSSPVYNSSRTNVSMKVDGEWRLGIEYNGHPIGYTFSDTWNFSYSI